MKNAQTTAALSIALFLTGVTFAQVALQDLGLLPTGGWSQGNAISADGNSVVGVAWSSTTNRRAFKWTSATGPVNLGVLTGTQSRANAVNSDGSVVVGFGTLASGFNQPARWTSGTGFVSLGPLPVTFVSGEAYGVSGDGSLICGAYSNSSSSLIQAFRWSSSTGAYAALPSLGGTLSVAYAISNDGSTIVGSSTLPAGQGGFTRAFRWSSSGGTQELPLPSGYNQATARAVSANGSVIVGDMNPTASFTGHAFRWTSATGMVYLQNTLLNAGATTPYACNGDGSIVVGRYKKNNADRAFVWTAEAGIVDLADYLAAAGVNLTGWQVWQASGISADGKSITGIAFLTGFDDHAYRIVNFPKPCPGDIGRQGGVAGADGLFDNNDFVAFIDLFFASDPRADQGIQGGAYGQDSQYDNNDFVAFINHFFAGC